MKTYVKPCIDVIELQLSENIAAVPTTVYKGKTKSASKAELYNMALSQEATGIKKDGPAGEYLVS